ncbi:LysR substrate-binding domain-containing protein [Massilia sp. DWR3-1-1]|uniref:LysR family transcriptional regulator n=1 Tax=Massilia sp. DWR3-1-1 TaxID=2804559 RepID=UPI003CEEFDF5
MDRLRHSLEELLAFVKVVDLKSFSAAALALASTKSTVSKQVARLEQVLGTRLLSRSTRHLALTETGAIVYQHGCRIAEQAVALVDAVDGLQERPRGHLRVTTSSAFGNLHLTRLLTGFLRQYPDIGISLVLADRYIDLVEEGFDLAVRLTSHPVDGLAARRLAAIDYALCATPAYLAAGAPLVTPADLAHHACVLGDPAAPSLWRFTRAGVTTALPVQGRLRVNSSESVRAAVLEGAGVGLLPLYAVQADLAAGRLQVALADYVVEGSFGDSVYAIFAPGKLMAPKVRVLIDFLVASFADGAPR